MADTVLARLTELYAPAADPGRAEGAAACMKHIAPFLGIPAPRRRALSKAVLAGTGRPDERDCTAIALRCWRLPEREYPYFAVAETALLHQLRYREATDTDRLFGYCLRRADHPDFFVRKAIGWALREYAKTDPTAVRDFVEGARTRLSPLSVREALKNL